MRFSNNCASFCPSVHFAGPVENSISLGEAFQQVLHFWSCGRVLQSDKGWENELYVAGKIHLLCGMGFDNRIY